MIVSVGSSWRNAKSLTSAVKSKTAAATDWIFIPGLKLQIRMFFQNALNLLKSRTSGPVEGPTVMLNPLQEEFHGYDVCKPGRELFSGAAFFLPVLLDVVSKLNDLIQFLTPHSDNTSIITSAIAWPVPDGNLGTERS